MPSNLQSILLPSLEKIFDTIDNFLVIYNSEKICEIIADFKPKDMKINPYSELNRSENTVYFYRLNESLDLIINYMKFTDTSYDNILLLRFDYMYLQPVYIEKLDLNIINFGWHYIDKSGNYDQTDDGFILFSPKYIYSMKNHIKYNAIPHQLQTTFKDNKYGYLTTGKIQEIHIIKSIGIIKINYRKKNTKTNSFK